MRNLKTIPYEKDLFLKLIALELSNLKKKKTFLKKNKTQ